MLVIDSNALSMVISDIPEGAAISFAAWIVIGLFVGVFGSKLLNKTGRSLKRDVLLSIVGAIVGGFLCVLLGKSNASQLDFYSLLVTAVSAVVFMLVYHALFRRRHLLSMRYLRR